ncbi:MAG: CHAD domain-containing protein [Thermoleophilaceae bacterium]
MAKAPSKEAAAAVVVAGAAAVGGKLAWDKLSGNGDDDPRAFCLHEGEAVPDGIRRIARAQLDSSIERLDPGNDGSDLAKDVHETRKSLKRLRSCLRLSRPALGDEIYRRENIAFRDAGRKLAGARDARVLLEALDDLGERFGDELPAEATADLRNELARDEQRAEASLDSAVSDVLGELRAARERTAEWTFAEDGFDAVAPGLRRIYRRGRKRMGAAKGERTDESLHEWRKRVKDLWYASQILRPAAPKRMKLFAGRAHDLSDLLGDDHDLALLGERSGPDRLALTGAIANRREQLQRGAFELGAELYEQSPKKFVRNFGRGF